jgi:hypothetical protein
VKFWLAPRFEITTCLLYLSIPGDLVSTLFIRYYTRCGFMETESKSAYNIFTAASYTVDKYDLSSLCTAK